MRTKATTILVPCEDCEDLGPHDVLDDEGDYVVVRCSECHVEFEVEL